MSTLRSRSFQVILPLLLALSLSCNRSAGPVSQSSGAQGTLDRHPLVGKVVAVDQPAASVTVDHEAIPGFMGAMTMPYPVKPASQLEGVQPGDSITADMVRDPAQGSYWLENVKVTRHGGGTPKPSSALHIPAVGEPVPDFTLVNQDGRRISLKQYRGRALLVTFIYTRCPFADYCPRVSNQFAEIDRQLQARSALKGKVHLLSISFDPAHDSPKVLRDYGFRCAGSKPAALFQRWEFAVAPASQLPKLATFFGLEYREEGGLITHNLSTAVIAPDGRIARWYHGSDWQAADLLRDAVEALTPPATGKNREGCCGSMVSAVGIEPTTY